MKNKNLIPLVLFCVVFLAYSLYFVKVINTTKQLEPNSIAKTIKRVMQQRDGGSDDTKIAQVLDEPVKRYVNYTWLNVRKTPSLSSDVVEKILKNAEVDVLGYPSSSWAHVQTDGGKKGYVARRYLSDKPVGGVKVAEEKKSTKVTAPSVTGTAPEIYEVPIITYHHISDETKKYSASMVLPEVNFFAQLDYLVSNGFTTYTFLDLKDIVDGKKKATDKAVILTFSGGYDDAYVASQHLNGKGMKGVFFITTDNIGQPGYLDWRQVKKMRSWGMEIGSQGSRGSNLVAANDFYLDEEVVQSKKTIEAQIGQPIHSFAYPLGSYSGRVMKKVEEAGYSFARSSNDGSRYSDKQFYMLPTLRVFFPAGAKQFKAWLD